MGKLNVSLHGKVLDIVNNYHRHRHNNYGGGYPQQGSAPPPSGYQQSGGYTGGYQTNQQPDPYSSYGERGYDDRRQDRNYDDGHYYPH